MPEKQGDTTERAAMSEQLSRRHLLQLTGAGVVAGGLTTNLSTAALGTATGDEADDETGIRHDEYDGVLGGGEGMPEDLVASSDDADLVVENGDELRAAVDSASEGDVIYIAGDVSGPLTVSTPGVTIAGNRGRGEDGRWTDASLDQNAPGLRLEGLSIDCGWSDFCAINDTGLEVYNCLVENHDGYSPFAWNTGDTGAHFSHCEFRNWNHYGLQIRYNWHTKADRITIQYCDFHDLGQHMIQGGYGWFHLRDNWFHGTLNHTPDHVFEVRNGDSSAPVPCDVPCGNAVVEHNLLEAVGSDGNPSALVRVRGVPTDGVWIRHNRAPNNTQPAGGCWQDDSSPQWQSQIATQHNSSNGGFDNVQISDNRR